MTRTMSGEGHRWTSSRVLEGLCILLASTLVLMANVGAARAGAGSVDCATGGNLQATIDAAASGDTILIHGTCVGNFQVLNGLTLKGNPTATLDGNGADTTLYVGSSDPVHLVDLTITGGFAHEGAGIRFSGAKLTLNGVVVHKNQAWATDSFSASYGGGINGSGSLVITNSKITDNTATASVSAEAALGGGIYNDGPPDHQRIPDRAQRTHRRCSGRRERGRRGLLHPRGPHDR
jgi:nitrous oxidase accessory protein NosD